MGRAWADELSEPIPNTNPNPDHGPGPTPFLNPRPTQAFAEADKDDDGTIDFAEFCATASSIGLGVSEAELRTAFGR